MAVSLFYTQQKKTRRVCRPQAAKIEIIFSRDMCVRENTSQAASVEFVRQRHTNYARSRLQAFCRKNPQVFSTVSKEIPLRRYLFSFIEREQEGFYSSGILAFGRLHLKCAASRRMAMTTALPSSRAVVSSSSRWHISHTNAPASAARA